jgi:hypothetical protein
MADGINPFFKKAGTAHRLVHRNLEGGRNHAIIVTEMLSLCYDVCLMADKKILGEIVTHCARCKLDLNHMITLMTGGLPKKVLCLTCKSEHVYRDPNRVVVKAAAKSTGGPVSTKSVAKVRQTREESEWRAMLLDTSRTPEPYGIDKAFEQDQHVYHPKFGLGVVVGFAHPDKIQIYFDDGVKVLKGGKA